MSDEKTDCVATLISGASYATGKRRFVNGKPMSVTREEAVYLQGTGAFNVQMPVADNGEAAKDRKAVKETEKHKKR